MSATGGQEKTCRVCGDRALAVNFGAMTCETCKAFFRRNARKQQELRCSFKGECAIDKTTRKFCSACRLAKCFSVGMMPELILDDTAKKARLEKLEAKKNEREKSGKRKEPAPRVTQTSVGLPSTQLQSLPSQTSVGLASTQLQSLPIQASESRHFSRTSPQMATAEQNAQSVQFAAYQQTGQNTSLQTSHAEYDENPSQLLSQTSVANSQLSQATSLVNQPMQHEASQSGPTVSQSTGGAYFSSAEFSTAQNVMVSEESGERLFTTVDGTQISVPRVYPNPSADLTSVDGDHVQHASRTLLQTPYSSDASTASLQTVFTASDEFSPTAAVSPSTIEELSHVLSPDMSAFSSSSDRTGFPLSDGSGGNGFPHSVSNFSGHSDQTTQYNRDEGRSIDNESAVAMASSSSSQSFIDTFLQQSLEGSQMCSQDFNLPYPVVVQHWATFVDTPYTFGIEENDITASIAEEYAQYTVPASTSTPPQPSPHLNANTTQTAPLSMAAATSNQPLLNDAPCTAVASQSQLSTASYVTPANQSQSSVAPYAAAANQSRSRVSLYAAAASQSQCSTTPCGRCECCLLSTGMGRMTFEHVRREELPSDMTRYWLLATEERVTLTHLSASYQDTLMKLTERDPDAPVRHGEEDGPLSMDQYMQMLDTVLHLCVRFAKSIPEFRQLDQGDQISALKSSSLPCFGVVASAAFLQEQEEWMSVVGQFGKKHYPPSLHSNEFVSEVADYCYSLKGVAKNDLALYALMHCLLLFDPRESSIQNRQLMNSHRDRYLVLLKHYLESEYSYLHSDRYFSVLVDLLVQVRYLGKKSFTFYRSIKEAKLRPLSAEILDAE